MKVQIAEMSYWGGPPVGICNPHQHRLCAEAIRALSISSADYRVSLGAPRARLQQRFGE